MLCERAPEPDRNCRNRAVAASAGVRSAALINRGPVPHAQ